MGKGVILNYDGSFGGFLTCVFTVFEQKLEVTSINSGTGIQQDFFSIPEEIVTDPEKAERVKQGLNRKISASGRRQLNFAFLSELPEIEILMLTYIKAAFTNKAFNCSDFGDPTVLQISQIAKKVSREKHRMEAFVRFMLTKDNIYFAHIEPDFNVLPLILPHFESRYADQEWILYDLKRKYGLHYNLHQTNYITLELPPDFSSESAKLNIFAASELEFQELWQQYFVSTNIKSRRNSRLHLQHIPKRYWKYLTEKSFLPK